nr:MAG TPA: hypothetical protein [Bacteriophage sp.]
MCPRTFPIHSFLCHKHPSNNTKLFCIYIIIAD